jgi:acetyl esterase/lipase
MKTLLKTILIVLTTISAFEYSSAQNVAHGYSLADNISYRDSVCENLDEYAKKNCNLDLYFPLDKKGFATVIWFHGGGLSGGKKEIPEKLKQQGFAVVGVEYRKNPVVKCPVYIEDAAAAVAWVFKNISKYGGDPRMIFLSGHSAGGYLNLMISMDKKWLRTHGIDADSIAGIIPLSPQVITHFKIRSERGIDEKQPIIDEYAPLFHVRKDLPPLVLITGDRELEMLGRYEENAYLMRMMKIVGHEKTSLFELDGFGHGPMMQPGLYLLVREINKLIEEKSAEVEVKTSAKLTPLIKVEAKRWVKGDNNQPWQYFDTRIIDKLNGFKIQGVDPVNKYGSSVSKKTTATGFYRVQKTGDRWWTIDPEGYLNIQTVINSYRQGTSERNKKAFNKLFSSESDWVDKSAKAMEEYGFNGIGSWSTHPLIIEYNSRNQHHNLSYSVNLSMMASYGRKRGGTYQLPGNIGFPNQTIFVFDPEFSSFCDSLAKAQISSLKNDPNLYGYFSDNELPFGVKNLEGYLTLKNPSDPGRQAAEKWLKNKGIEPNHITDQHRNEFAGLVAERYFRIVSEAIRKADPNHMYMGSRLHGSAKFVPEIMQAAGKYCDVVSINYYGVWTPVKEHLGNWAVWTGKPFIITEFYTKAMDAGLANTTGAGYTVRTQKDKGYAYQDFCLALLESKNCVGWHYFKYQDNDPTAKGVDPSNIDSNKGVVDNEYRYYTDLMQLMQQLNRRVYSLTDYFDN